MAVIIKGIEMPKSCADCPLCHCKGKDDPWNYVCFVTMDDINIEEWDNERYVTCPLESVDGLINKVNACKQSHPSSLSESGDSTADKIHESQMAGAYSHCIEIIKEYCKEQKEWLEENYGDFSEETKREVDRIFEMDK